MRIDFVSDVVCPWCAIGMASLQTALRRLGPQVPVDFHVQPFELNPQLGAEGEDIVEHLSRKYGISREEIERNRAAIEARGAAVGFRFGPRSHTWNTFDAHRLLHWAGLKGQGLALKQALLEAYHGRGENISQADVLAAAAASVGLDVLEARRVLDDERAHADEVRAAQRHWRDAGINSVPAVVIDGRWLVSGGHPPEVFEQALRKAVAEAS